jgi:hypothetical protein
MAEAAAEFEKEASATLGTIREQAEHSEDLLEDIASTIEDSNDDLEASILELKKAVEGLQAEQVSPWVEYLKVLLLAGILAGVGTLATTGL